MLKPFIVFCNTTSDAVNGWSRVLGSATTKTIKFLQSAECMSPITIHESARVFGALDRAKRGIPQLKRKVPASSEV